ncbi:tRNA-splicing endonuclease subunit sen54 N-term-domain-containing protein [Cladochytrium replicatum]|nr:tRNA-splicing endonuclease subunit sen54 N-term-domain-containing protein [Cladochytrium replicatum]
MDEEWDDDRPLDYAAVDNRKEAKKKFRAQLSRSKGTPTTDEDTSPTEEDPKNANTINTMSTGPEPPAGYVMMLKEQRRGKNMSQGVWDPSIHRAVITKPRGVHFETMGLTVNKEIQLLPEEAMFLVDRGSLALQTKRASNSGVAMSVQHCYAAMVSIEGSKNGETVTMDEYLVYGYLRRLGFVVMRYKDPPSRASSDTSITPFTKSIWSKISLLFSNAYRAIVESAQRASSWLLPGQLWQGNPESLVDMRRYNSEKNVFRDLKIVPCATNAKKSGPGEQQPNCLKHGSTIIKPQFSVWRPTPNFRKSAPGPPAWHLFVVR